MDYEKRHYAYKPTLGGRSIPADRLINDLGDDAINYVGTYSIYNPIGLKDNLLAVVIKPSSFHTKRDFKLTGFSLSAGLSTTGGNVTTNYSIKFSKQELFRIASEMDVDDNLTICYVEGLYGNINNVEKIKQDINKVTGM